MAGCFLYQRDTLKSEFIFAGYWKIMFMFFLDTNQRCYVIITWWRKLL
jgi:hypothetical protein